MKKKGLALILSFAMVLSIVPMTAFGQDFTDMPTNWSRPAVEKALENGLLKGDKGKVRPEENLTRAEMATVVNRAFKAVDKAPLTKFTDIGQSDWYYEEMAKAVQMGTFVGSGDKLNPQANITRQEAFVVLARAFKISEKDQTVLNAFSDKDHISTWAKEDLAGLVKAGYVAGVNSKINPKANITRAEFAQIMDNLVKTYITQEGTYTEDLTGNVMVNQPGVVLKGITITGDLIVGDGVGKGDLILEDTTIRGRMVVRGGGEDSIIIRGTSDVKSITIAKVDGKVRVYNQDGAEIGEVILDGKDDVILEGKFESVTIEASNTTLIARGADIKSALVVGENSNIVVDKNSSLDKIRVNGNNTKIEGEGVVKEVEANGSNLTVDTKDTQVKDSEGKVIGRAGGNQETRGTGTFTPVSVTGVIISGEAVFGETLIASPSPNGATGTYQWMRAGTESGEYTNITNNSNIYSLITEDVNKFIKVYFTASGSYSGTVTSGSREISKADGPAAPTGVGKTDETGLDLNDGTLTGVATGQEYNIGGAETWTLITGETVTRLAPANYTVRIAETTTHKAGMPTSPLVIIEVLSTDATLSNVSGATVDASKVTVPVDTVFENLEDYLNPTYDGASYRVFLADGVTEATEDNATYIHGLRCLVTAQDGLTKKEYAVEKPLSTDATLSNVSGATVDASKVTVPVDTVFENLEDYLNPTYDGASYRVFLADGVTEATESNITNTINGLPDIRGLVVIVTAEDGVTTKDYTVVRPTSTEASVDSSAIGTKFYGDWSFTPYYNVIKNVPNETSLAAFKAGIKLSSPYATFEIYEANGTTLALDLKDAYILKVFAENGIQKNGHKIRFVTSSDARLDDSSPMGGTINHDAGTLQVDYSTTFDSLDYMIEARDNGSYVIYLNNKTTVATEENISTEHGEINGLPNINGLVVIVTAEDGVTTKEYTITKQVSSYVRVEFSIGTYGNNDGAFSPHDKIRKEIPNTTTLADLKAAITVSPYARFEIYEADGTTIATDLKDRYVVIGTAESGDQTDSYTIRFVTSSDARLDDSDPMGGTINHDAGTLQVDGSTTFDSLDDMIKARDNGSYLIYLNDKTTVATEENISTVHGEINGLPNINGLVVIVTAEDGTTTKEYTVTKQVSTHNYPDSSEFNVISGDPHRITNIPSGTTLTNFKAGITPPAYGTIEVYEANGTTVAVDLQSGYKLTATAEDGTTTRTYEIILNP